MNIGQLIAQHAAERFPIAFHQVDQRALHAVICGNQAFAQRAVRNFHHLCNYILRNAQNVLQRAVHHFDDAENKQKVQRHGHTACRHGKAVFLLEFHQLFLLAVFVFGVLFLNFLHLRLESRHARGALLLFDAQRKQNQVHQKREHNEGPAVIGNEPVNPLHNRPKDDCEKT